MENNIKKKKKKKRLRGVILYIVDVRTMYTGGGEF